MDAKRMPLCGMFLYGCTCGPPGDIDARKLSWCWPIAPECSVRDQAGAMMPSSAVQTTRPETIVAVGPPRNVAPPNGEFLLFESV